MIGLFFLLLPLSFCLQQAAPDVETYLQKTVDKNSVLIRSHLTGEFKKIGPDSYLLNEYGRGDYRDFKDITWHMESGIELKEGFLCPLYTRSLIRDKSGCTIFSFKNDYDYRQKTITVTQRGPEGKLVKELGLPLRNKTTDSATLVYFLRPFIPEIARGRPIRFNFVSSEPAVYRLKAEFIKEDVLTVGSERVEAIKLRIVPDMGFISPIARSFAPATFLWYSKDVPYAWLKYEGLEYGRGSAYITTIVEEINPAL